MFFLVLLPSGLGSTLSLHAHDRDSRWKSKNKSQLKEHNELLQVRYRWLNACLLWWKHAQGRSYLRGLQLLRLQIAL